MVHAADTREQARGALVDGWDLARQAEPGKSRVILTHTNAEVRELNEEARGRLRATGDLGSDVAFSADRGARQFASGDRLMFLRNERSLGVKNGTPRHGEASDRDRLRASGDLGDDVTVKAERGERQFATGDRIMFLRNERGMGVKNGTLATIERVSPEGMAVRLDDGRGVAFDTKDYAHVDHGYAATFHKSQGVTVDRTMSSLPPAWTATAPMSACRGIVTTCSSIMAATTSPTSASSSAPCRATGARTWPATTPAPSRTRRARSPTRREIRFPELARQVVGEGPRQGAEACSTVSGRSRRPRRRRRPSVPRPIGRWRPRRPARSNAMGAPQPI